MSEFAAIVDARIYEPKDKHPKIFEAFNKLNKGEKMELLNDHDPKPLYYQMLAENQGQFEWEYLQEGPDLWKVSITKLV